MILPNSKDAFHKAQLYRLLTEIIDNPMLAASLSFKGDTCATMLGYLDRFSVDLDFDLKPGSKPKEIRRELQEIFKELDLAIKDESKNVLQFFLRYKANDPNQRNTIKLDILDSAAKSNIYKPQNLLEIDRIFECQTIETMFANKLVALIDRHEKNTTIAGRDVYDIHHFFMSGYSYNEKVIIERTKKNLPDFFEKLILFIEERITRNILQQDLNTLLPAESFSRKVKFLKEETLVFLKDELKRTNAG